MSGLLWERAVFLVMPSVVMAGKTTVVAPIYRLVMVACLVERIRTGVARA
jgi:hypothetical protein